MSLSDEKYLAVTTFRKSGEGVPTPTWVVPVAGGRLGFWTASTTGKVKRLTNNPQVVVSVCDARGRVRAGAATHDGTAELLRGGAEFDAVVKAVKAKYGWQTHVTKWIAKLVKFGKPYPYADTVVVLTVAE